MKKFFSILVVFLLMNMVILPSSAQAQLAWFLGNPMVGEKAEDFTLNTTSDKKLSLETVRDGQKAVVFFWATWCPHCRTELKDLYSRKEELGKKEIKILLVNIGEPASKVKSFMKRNGIAFNVFLDKDTAVASDYNVAGVPTYIFMNKKGVVQAVEHSIPKNYEAILSKE